MTNEQMHPAAKQPVEMSAWSAFAFVGELGFIIAIPAFLFGFGGAYLDKYMNTSPMFIALGLFIAVVSSSIVAYRRIQIVLRSSL